MQDESRLWSRIDRTRGFHANARNGVPQILDSVQYEGHKLVSYIPYPPSMAGLDCLATVEFKLCSVLRINLGF